MDKQRTPGCADNPHGVLELPVLERTLLWSIRTWAAYHDEPQSVWWPLDRAFTDAGIRPALEPFAQLMCALFAGLKRCPDIRCVRCPRLGRDEHELLSILADALHEPVQAINLRLRHLMLPSAARTAADAVQEMMRIVANAGLSLQQGHAVVVNTSSGPASVNLTMH